VETLGAFSLTFVCALCYYYIMKKFNTVEDYLEVISGYKDIVTGNKSSNWFMGFNPIISLARYDTDVLDSMSQAASNGQALTERQGTLACKIILKYQRQLAAKCVDVSPVENPVWRLPLRVMDYSRSMFIRDDRIKLRFPYESKMIERIRDFRKESQGVCEFNREEKLWNIALTEYNLSWIYTWAKHHEFEVDPAVQQLVDQILDVEKSNYAIELVCTESGLDITNCPASMREYINDKLGGFGLDNLSVLIDASSELGFTVNEDLSSALITEYGPRFVRLSSHRELRVSPESRTVDDDLASVLEYAERTNRLPVVIYEPDLSNRLLNRLLELYPHDQIQTWSNQKTFELEPGKKFIHAIKPVRNMERIPMLISAAGMVFGGDKQIMIQSAAKIVYVAAEVYNKSSVTRKVPKIAG
jgi:hypothetical protein